MFPVGSSGLEDQVLSGECRTWWSLCVSGHEEDPESKVARGRAGGKVDMWWMPKVSRST